MLIRYSKEEFQSLIDSETPFILMVYNMNQGKKIEGTTQFYDMLSIYPTFVKKIDTVKLNSFELRNELTEFNQEIPDIKIVESYHYEVYDILTDLGYDYDLLWDSLNNMFRPLMLGFKKYDEHKSSYSECYCIETLTNLSIYTNPELFEPSSVSES